MRGRPRLERRAVQSNGGTSPRSVKGYVGDIPLNYDRGLGPVLFKPYAEEAARRVAQRSPRDVLEIAAGSGVATRELRDRLSGETRLTATDISAPMLDVARSKFRADEQVSFELVDALALPYANESFDVVVCQFGYMFFPDKRKAMREALRALRPGGRYVLSVWDAEKYNPYASHGLAALKEFFPSDPPLWLKEPVSCAAIDPIKENLIASGFENVDISVITRRRDIDPLHFARGLVFGSPVIEASTRKRSPAPSRKRSCAISGRTRRSIRCRRSCSRPTSRNSRLARRAPDSESVIISASDTLSHPLKKQRGGFRAPPQFDIAADEAQPLRYYGANFAIERSPLTA